MLVTTDTNLFHFAIIMVMASEIGLLTPPVGLNLFVVSGIAGEPLTKAIKGVIPFIFLILIVLLIVVLWEELPLYLLS